MELQEKISFTQKTLRTLEKYLLAPEECLLVLSKKELNAQKGGLFYFRPAFWAENELQNGEMCLYYFALCGDRLSRFGKTRSSLLLCQVVDKLSEIFVNDVRIQDNKISYFSSHGDVDDDPEVLAEYIFTGLFKSVETFYEQTLGFSFATITAVAERAYEGDAALGRIVLHSSDEDLSEACLLQTVEKPAVLLEPGSARLIRRLLAGAGKNGLLFIRTDGKYQFRGYLKLDTEPEADLDPDMPAVIRIDGKGAWTLVLAGQRVFKVKGNRVYMPLCPQETMGRFLTDRLGEEFCDLLPALEVLSQQKHGTSAVLLNLDVEYVHTWMDNLAQCGRAFQVKPIPLWAGSDQWEEVKQLLKSVSRIDGTIIVHYPTREIRYISAIVDGQAVSGGMPDAGARHNALYAFVQNLIKRGEGQPQASPVLAFVFSEDGDITTMPRMN